MGMMNLLDTIVMLIKDTARTIARGIINFIFLPIGLAFIWKGNQDLYWLGIAGAFLVYAGIDGIIIHLKREAKKKKEELKLA